MYLFYRLFFFVPFIDLIITSSISAYHLQDLESYTCPNTLHLVFSLSQFVQINPSSPFLSLPTPRRILYHDPFLIPPKYSCSPPALLNLHLIYSIN